MTLLPTSDHDSEANHTNNSKSDPGSADYATSTSQQLPSQEQALVAEKQAVPAFNTDKANTRSEARYILYNYRGDVNHGNSDSDPDVLPVRCRIENVIEATKNMRRNRRELEQAEACKTPPSCEGVKERSAAQNGGNKTRCNQDSQAKHDGSEPGIKRKSSMLEIFGTAD